MARRRPLGDPNTSGNPPVLAASATMRWYAILNSVTTNGATVQPFDASAAAIGGSFAIPTALGGPDLLADGSDVLSIDALPDNQLGIERLGAAGAVKSTLALGIGTYATNLDHAGAAIAVAWDAAQHDNLAVVSP